MTRFRHNCTPQSETLPLCGGRRNDTFCNGIYQPISTCWNESLPALIKRTVCWKWRMCAFLSNVACTITACLPAADRDSDSLRHRRRASPGFKSLSLFLIYLKIIKSFSTSPYIVDSFHPVLDYLSPYVLHRVDVDKILVSNKRAHDIASSIVHQESRSVANPLKALSIDDDWRPIILYSLRVGDAAPLINYPEWFRSHRRILFRLPCCCCYCCSCATSHTRWRRRRVSSMHAVAQHRGNDLTRSTMHYSDDGSASWHP